MTNLDLAISAKFNAPAPILERQRLYDMVERGVAKVNESLKKANINYVFETTQNPEAQTLRLERTDQKLSKIEQANIVYDDQAKGCFAGDRVELVGGLSEVVVQHALKWMSVKLDYWLDENQKAALTKALKAVSRVPEPA